MKKQIFALLLMALLLAACATAPPLQLTVEERAQARWDLMLANQFERAWELYSPGYRESVQQMAFVRNQLQRRVRWLEASVQGAECEEQDRCTVHTEIRYDVPSAPHGMNRMVNTRTIQETWIRVGGEWWYVSDI
jgi:hypothetical protein